MVVIDVLRCFVVTQRFVALVYSVGVGVALRSNEPATMIITRLSEYSKSVRVNEPTSLSASPPTGILVA